MAGVLVYDSGIGGLGLLKKLKNSTTNIDYYYMFDSLNLPYGSKKEEELTEIALKNIRTMSKKYEIDLAIIACNSLTAIAIDKLRSEFDFHILGVEPAIKSASKSGEPLLLATPITIEAERIKQRFNRFNYDCLSLRLLAQMVEKDVLRALKSNKTLHEKKYCSCTQIKNYRIVDGYSQQSISDYIKYEFNKNSQLIEKFGSVKNVNCVVIGCTHYSYISDVIASIFSRAIVFDGINGVYNYAMQKINNLQSEIENKIQNDDNRIPTNNIKIKDETKIQSNIYKEETKIQSNNNKQKDETSIITNNVNIQSNQTNKTDKTEYLNKNSPKKKTESKKNAEYQNTVTFVDIGENKELTKQYSLLFSLL